MADDRAGEGAAETTGRAAGKAERGADQPGELAGAEPAGSHLGESDLLLTIDTATSTAVVAVGSHRGDLQAEDTWQAGYRHGEELLVRIDALLRRCDLRLNAIGAIVVGTGPGAFTGLRVGLATAKGFAHGLGIPIVGVPTSTALLAAAASGRGSANDAPAANDGLPGPEPSSLALLLPAGPADRTLVLAGEPRLLPGGQEPDVPEGTQLVAVDLDGRAPDGAVRLGAVALGGLAGALLKLGAARLAEGNGDDVAQLVPEYVTLPRGVRSTSGEVQWSRDRR